MSRKCGYAVGSNGESCVGDVAHPEILKNLADVVIESVTGEEQFEEGFVLDESPKQEDITDK